MTDFVCTIDETGIHAPTYADILTLLETQFRAIYGADVYIDPDSQDGQWLAILAQAISDTNSMAVAVYNAFSPSTAQGAGLSRVVKINGLSRSVATNSSCDVVLTGVAGTVVSSGVVADTNGNKWDLPDTVTIPYGGQVTATATAQEEGDISAAIGTITTISTPTYGWQSVTNTVAATAGDPVETDATLRKRQAASTALPSASIVSGMRGAILALSGVTSCKIYDNDTAATDENGIPGHTISAVVEGGDSEAIADVIANKKGPGTGTYGSTSTLITDESGLTRTIRFQRPSEVGIKVAVNLSALTGYTDTIGDQIKQAVADYLNTLSDGDDVFYGRIWTPANLSGGANSSTYQINSIQIARDGDPLGTANLTMGYAERAVGDPDLVTITVS